MPATGPGEASLHAGGPFRTDAHDDGPHEGIRWGLCHAVHGQRWNYIQRFDINDRLKTSLLRKESINL